MIRSEYVSNHIKSKKKIKYSYIVIKKRAHLLVEILMKEGNIIEQGSRRLGINLLYELITVLETDANTILVVHRKNPDLSIDKELMKLTPKVRIYFQKQFLNMIEEFPIK